MRQENGLHRQTYDQLAEKRCQQEKSKNFIVKMKARE